MKTGLAADTASPVFLYSSRLASLPSHAYVGCGCNATPAAPQSANAGVTIVYSKSLVAANVQQIAGLMHHAPAAC
jgi:hypothetical protein